MSLYYKRSWTTKILIIFEKKGFNIYDKNLNLIFNNDSEEKQYESIKILDENNFIALINNIELIQISLKDKIYYETLLKFNEKINNIIYYKKNLIITKFDNKGFTILELLSNKKYQTITNFNYKPKSELYYDYNLIYLVKNSDILMNYDYLGSAIIFWDLKKYENYFEIYFSNSGKCEFFCQINEQKIIFAIQVCSYTPGDDPPSDIYLYNIKTKELISHVSTINSLENSLWFSNISYLEEKGYILISFYNQTKNSYYIQIYDKDFQQKLFSYKYNDDECYQLFYKFKYFYKNEDESDEIIISYHNWNSLFFFSLK